MKVLFPALRVTDLDASLAFYTSVGFEVIGRVEPSEGIQLVMLALPHQTEVSLELVQSEADDPATPGGLDHLAMQVDDLDTSRGELRAAGLDVGPVETPAARTGRIPRRCSTPTATTSSSSSGRPATRSP
jgi:lactoylglutathione lyase